MIKFTKVQKEIVEWCLTAMYAHTEDNPDRAFDDDQVPFFALHSDELEFDHPLSLEKVIDTELSYQLQRYVEHSYDHRDGWDRNSLDHAREVRSVNLIMKKLDVFFDARHKKSLATIEATEVQQ